MELSHRVALNGIQLDSVDSRIIIKAVEEGAGKEQITGAARSGGFGQRITGRRRETMDITVRFSINLFDDEMEARGKVLEEVNRWAAGGGILTLSYRPGRQAHVVLAQAPGGGDLYEWTNVYSLTFRAYGIPYWEDASGSQVRTQGVSSGSVTIGVNGSAKCPTEFTFRNTSGSTCNWFQISGGGYTIRLEGLALANGETLSLDHDGEGVQRIRIQATGGAMRSAMSKRVQLAGGGPSADEIWLDPGSRQVSMSAERAGTLTVICKGRYL